MIINELLVEKYRTQKSLDNLAKHDLVAYVSNSHTMVKELADTLGLHLRYGTPYGIVHEDADITTKPEYASYSIM